MKKSLKRREFIAAGLAGTAGLVIPNIMEKKLPTDDIKKDTNVYKQVVYISSGNTTKFIVNGVEYYTITYVSENNSLYYHVLLPTSGQTHKIQIRPKLPYPKTEIDQNLKFIYETAYIKIHNSICVQCQACISLCPKGIIKSLFKINSVDRPHIEEPQLCNGCFECCDCCPADAIERK